jgi:hypothetical protein
MITGTILKNGVIKLFLTGTDSIDEAILKELNGAHCKLVTENFRLGDKSITGALIIEKPVNGTGNDSSFKTAE